MKLILKIWKDPVWSKVISAGILFAIGYIWVLLSPEMFKKFMYYKFAVWQALTVALAVLLFFGLKAKFTKKKEYLYTEHGKQTDKESFEYLIRNHMDTDFLLPWLRKGASIDEFSRNVLSHLRMAMKGYSNTNYEFLNPAIENHRKKLQEDLQLILDSLPFILEESGEDRFSYRGINKAFQADLGEGRESTRVRRTLMFEAKNRFCINYDEFIRAFKREQAK